MDKQIVIQPENGIWLLSDFFKEAMKPQKDMDEP